MLRGKHEEKLTWVSKVMQYIKSKKFLTSWISNNDLFWKLTVIENVLSQLFIDQI